MALLEGSLLGSQGRPVAPEEQEGIGQDQVVAAAQHAKTGIDKEIRQIVRVAHDTVHAVPAKDLVAYEYALCDKMNEAPHNKEKKSRRDLAVAYPEKERAGRGKDQNRISEPTPRKKALAPLSGRPLPPVHPSLACGSPT